MLGLELGDQLVDGDVELRAVLARPRDDQRRARLVDQDRIHLVDDREIMIALQHLREVGLHVVAQVVEAQLVVGGIGDVGVVGDLLVGLGHAGHHHADAHPQRVIDQPHPLGVAPGEIVVHRHHVHAAARERVEIDRQRRHQGLALAGLHLGNIAFVQEDAAHQLHIEGSLAQRPPGGFAGIGEGLGQQVVEALALAEPVAELRGLLPDSRVAQRAVLGLQRVDPLDGRPRRLDLSIVGSPEDLASKRAQSQHTLIPIPRRPGATPARPTRLRPTELS